MKNSKKIISSIICMVLAITMISGYVFAESEDDYTFYIIDDKAVITNYNGDATEIIIPDKLGGVPVVALEGVNEYGVFGKPITNKSEWKNNRGSSVSGITGVTLPDSITTIGKNAFRSCEKLKNIIFSPNIITIGDSAFESCKALETIIIPNGVTTIGCDAFVDCVLLKSVQIPDSITSIGLRTFNDCPSLTEIIVESSNSIYSSEGGVLFNKDKTTLLSCSGGIAGKYLVPQSVTSISENAFRYQNKLTEIVFSDNITNIGYCAFFNCEALKGVTITDSVTTIDELAFNGCKALKTVNIGKGVKKISQRAFSGCGINVLDIPQGVETIEKYAFSECKSLKEVTIPNSVTLIGKHAFDISNDSRPGYYNIIVINCDKNSYAQKYAEKNKISFKLINEPVLNYNVQFKKSEINVTGKMKKQNFTYGIVKSLAKCKYKKSGYKFNGWNTKKNGKGKTYKNKAKIQTLAKKNGEVISLFAKWKKK